MYYPAVADSYLGYHPQEGLLQQPETRFGGISQFFKAPDEISPHLPFQRARLKESS